MLKTSLYANLNSEISKEKIIQLIGSQELESKLKGMKELISQISQGKSYTSITHTVIKDVLSSPSNELKRLFYYFLEISMPFMADNELLLLSNQIRKDLEHPNEFVRGAVLQFVSRMVSVDILLNFQKPVLENFNHPIAFVRRNAYFCLAFVSSRLGIFEDTTEHLLAALNRDTDPNCLCQAFSSLFCLDQSKAIEYAYESLNSVSLSRELSLCMIEKVKETDFLLHFLINENPTVRMEAALVLTDTTTDEYILEKCAGVIADNIKANKAYLSLALNKLFKISSYVDVSKYGLSILELIDPYDLEASRSILDFVIQVAATQDLIIILNFITRKSQVYGSTTPLKSNGINILLLQKLSLFVSKYSVFSPEVVDLGIEKSKSSNPALSYEALQVLKSLLKNEPTQKEKILDHLLNLLPTVQFGKIFREVLEILASNGESQNLKNAILIFKKSLEKNETINTLWLQKENIFLISFISISLTEMYYKSQDDKMSSNLLVDLLALLLSFFRLVKDNDLSSTGTIVSCIRRLLSPVSKPHLSTGNQKSVAKRNVCDPLDFPFLRIKENEKIQMLDKFLNAREQNESLSNVHQLTGLSDPIYVECNVIYSRFEIVLDILMINQTDSYLQNMLFDFGSSPNLKPSYVSTPENMKARSAVSRKLVFKVLNSSNGFINGSVTFKYPSASGEYANRVYTLNFSEIKTYVSDFLEPKTISSEDFRELWKKMEWENVYSVKLVSDSPLVDILNIFRGKLKGNIVDCKDNEDFLVGNISATTKQNNDILFNVCMTKDSKFINLECRVRSSKEEVVKSLNDILNEVVKMNKKNN